MLHPGANLQESLKQERISRVVGAHNALGARVVERSGFDALWVSGLEVSASFGLPDVGLLTMTELLESARHIRNAVEIPVIVDCDTGFGSEVNVVRLVRDSVRTGLAGLCVEDKVFPKRNSFMSGGQELIDTDSFCRKLRAGRRAAGPDEVQLIARTEALVAGEPVEEALRRCELYVEAGADAVLLHAKDRSPERVLRFLEQWPQRAPVVLVPTTYYEISAEELEAAGAAMVIYANHGMRSAIRAMEETFSTIRDSGSTVKVEERIAPVQEIFALQHVDSWMSYQK